MLGVITVKVISISAQNPVKHDYPGLDNLISDQGCPVGTKLVRAELPLRQCEGQEVDVSGGACMLRKPSDPK